MLVTVLCCFIDIDDCVGHTCVNGATCVDGVNSFTCDCVLGYEGTNCETGNTFLPTWI